ncbi:B3 domain-containing protein Os12g0592300 isoform X2 [Lolium perenne]|uniref:B3 domain-containing protein Os12g0592300 isoform X2 n=1 Tax=Lolium perenne TaxID=4522 RepID=UPI0021F55BC3|nr:B3 domain-containing protein Os12g0592300-like isoform X2 [Lolium perenne]
MAGDEKGRCVKCREWQEHYFWEHMDLSNIRFFKHMIGDFQHRVSIPEKVANNFTRLMAKEGFTLKSPSGETWCVAAEKIADELFFVSGWEEFVKDHELQENDLLLFECSGIGCFDVRIFDSSGSEKASCFFTDKKGTNMHRHFDNIMGQQAEGHCRLSDSNNAIVPLSQPVGSPHKASASKKPIKEAESPNNSNYQDKCVVDDEEEESDNEHTYSNYSYSRLASHLTADEREQIFGLASIQPRNPVFVVVLQKSHVRGAKNILIIPSKFAAEHLEGKSHEVLLLRPNSKEQWHVKYYHASLTRGFNGGRWVKFVRDNSLCEGYVCIFELMRGARKVTMTVHVVRKVEDQFVLLG